MVESLGSTLDHLFPTHVGHNLASMLYILSLRFTKYVAGLRHI